MSFNPDPIKGTQKVIFSGETITQNHPIIYFNQNPIMQTNSQKHLGVFLDTRLDFNEHLTNTFTKANRNVGLFRKFQKLWSS